MKCYKKTCYSLWGYLPLLLCLSFILMANASCTFPSEGYYARMENKAEMNLFTLKKIDENTRALVLNTGNELEINAWKKRIGQIEKPVQAPGDKNSGNWIETLLYILLGMSGLGGMAKGAGFLYKIKPRN